MRCCCNGSFHVGARTQEQLTDFFVCAHKEMCRCTFIPDKNVLVCLLNKFWLKFCFKKCGLGRKKPQIKLDSKKRNWEVIFTDSSLNVSVKCSNQPKFTTWLISHVLRSICAHKLQTFQEWFCAGPPWKSKWVACSVSLRAAFKVSCLCRAQLLPLLRFSAQLLGIIQEMSGMIVQINDKLVEMCLCLSSMSLILFANGVRDCHHFSTEATLAPKAWQTKWTVTCFPLSDNVLSSEEGRLQIITALLCWKEAFFSFIEWGFYNLTALFITFPLFPPNRNILLTDVI